MVKTIHIHVGPHKTGSTAIQEALRSHGQFLRERLGLTLIEGELISEIAEFLKNADEIEISRRLMELSRRCELAPRDCVISCEDFAGDLPGRSAGRRPYPKLFRNISLILKALAPNRCIFYFFVRERDAWLKSAYVQNLRYRTRFNSLDKFENYIKCDDLWSGVLQKASKKLGSQLVTIPYREDSEFSSVKALLTRISNSGDAEDFGFMHYRANVMPDRNTIRVLECINRSSASSEAKQKAKRCIDAPGTGKQTFSGGMGFPNWKKRPMKPGWISNNLENLWKRVEQRVYAQNQPNLLPDPSIDLAPLRSQLVSAPREFPQGGRGEMENQKKILAFRFNGFPKTCLLLGLVISYLRRQTDHTDHAAYLFHRLWEEEHEILLGTLQTRWLISTFQTFLDHGANEQQRIIGGSAYFFSNLLKAFEAERALDGLEPDAIYANTKPVTKNGFAGLDRFNLGGTDLVLNTNALLLEIASKDKSCGRVVQEFLLRMKKASTMFSRIDYSRIAYDIDNPQFENCWSFFEKPK